MTIEQMAVLAIVNASSIPLDKRAIGYRALGLWSTPGDFESSLRRFTEAVERCATAGYLSVGPYNKKPGYVLTQEGEKVLDCGLRSFGAMIALGK